MVENHTEVIKMNKTFLLESFDFLIKDFNFKLIEIKSDRGALYAKFRSDLVFINFLYEYRDFIPEVLFSLANEDENYFRVGLYTLEKSYANPDFILKSFYINEIIEFKKGSDNYKNYFENISTIKEAIHICADVVKTECSDFIKGNNKSYQEINKWFKNLILSNSQKGK